MAMTDGNLAVAKRCCSALGDVSRAYALRDIEQIALTQPGGMNHFMVRARLAIINKQFKRAEAIFMEQGHIEEAIEMYRKLHKWEEALALAQTRGLQTVRQLRNDYITYLM